MLVSLGSVVVVMKMAMLLSLTLAARPPYSIAWNRPWSLIHAGRASRAVHGGSDSVDPEVGSVSLIQVGRAAHFAPDGLSGAYPELAAYPYSDAGGWAMFQHNFTVHQDAAPMQTPVPGLRICCRREKDHAMPWTSNSSTPPAPGGAQEAKAGVTLRLAAQSARVGNLLHHNSSSRAGPPALAAVASQVAASPSPRPQNPGFGTALAGAAPPLGGRPRPHFAGYNAALADVSASQPSVDAPRFGAALVGAVPPLGGGPRAQHAGYIATLADVHASQPPLDAASPRARHALVEEGAGAAIAIAASLPLVHSGGDPRDAGSHAAWHAQVFSMPAYIRILAAVVLMFVGLLGLCCVCLRCAGPSARPSDADTDSRIHKWVESLPIRVCGGLEHRLEVSGGPGSPRQPQAAGVAVVRVEGRAVAPPGTAALSTPFSQRPCLLFSASATELHLGGGSAPPVTQHAAVPQIQLEVLSDGERAPPERIHISGLDVGLFSMAGGRWRRELPVGSAPAHCQEFLRAHCATWSLPGRSGVLDFSERFLDVGAVVTCVGRLERTDAGDLQLLPIEHVDITATTAFAGCGASDDARPYALADPPGADTSLDSPARRHSLGLTSWECAELADIEVGKVLVSDHPQLLGPNASGHLGKRMCALN